MFATTPAFAEATPSVAGSVLETLLALEVFSFIGLAVVALTLVMVLLIVLRGAGWVVDGLARALQLGRIRRDEVVGSKILIAGVEGARAKRIRNRLMDAIEADLAAFIFGAGFKVYGLGAHFDAAGSVNSHIGMTNRKRAEAMLAKSGADLIIWGVTDRSRNVCQLCLLAAPASDTDETRFLVSDIPMSVGENAEAWDRTIAYLAARALLPDFGNPDAFRAERLLPVLEAMDGLADADTLLSLETARQYEDDFTAIALHVGRDLKASKWLEKVASRRRTLLETLKPDDDPERWARTKLDLGVALSGLGRQTSNAAQLEEAKVHLGEAIASLRADGQLARMEAALKDLAKVEEPAANRRPFAVRWS